MCRVVVIALSAKAIPAAFLTAVGANRNSAIRALLVGHDTVLGSQVLGILRARCEPTQECYGEYQNKNEQAQQAKLNHAGSKYARILGRKRSSFCEVRGFQGNNKDAPYRGDQAHHQEWLRNQKMRERGNGRAVQ